MTEEEDARAEAFFRWIAGLLPSGSHDEAYARLMAFLRENGSTLDAEMKGLLRHIADDSEVTTRAFRGGLAAIGAILERHGIPLSEFAAELRGAAALPGMSPPLAAQLLRNVADDIAFCAPTIKN